MKINNKGFMMAEVIVVSAIVLVFLTGLFLSYNKIYSIYSTRLDYTDTSSLYRLGFYRDYYVHEGSFDDIKNNAKNNEIEIISSIDNSDYDEKVFLIYNDFGNIKNNLLDDKDVNRTYMDYINYLSSSTDLTNSMYVMIIERCNKIDHDDCKYAYLEVSDET